MANIAIVIGIDKYQTALTSLTGAVEDAIEFASWLFSSKEVDPANLHLGFGPDLGSPKVPEDLAACPTFVPSLDELDNLLADLVNHPRPGIERLYFFFSGHGIAVDASYYTTDAICLSGFRDQAFGKALEIDSLKTVLIGIAAEKRFIFLDGCRDIAYQKGAQFGRLGRSPPPAPGPRQAFILHATSAGRKAAEVGNRGLFSRHLCRGLRGEGSAKRWDGDANGGAGLYRVRWGALSRFVADEVAKWARSKGVADDTQLVTIGGGEMIANVDPIFAELPAARFPALPVRIMLKQPAPAPNGATIYARRAETGELDRLYNLDDGNPAMFDLPPSAWVIWANAPAHSSKPRQKTLLVYDGPFEDEIDLVAVAPAPLPGDAPRDTGVTDIVGSPVDIGPDTTIVSRPVEGFPGSGTPFDFEASIGPLPPSAWEGIDDARADEPEPAEPSSVAEAGEPDQEGPTPAAEASSDDDGRLIIRVGDRSLDEIQPPLRISVSRESGDIVANNPGSEGVLLRPNVYRVRVSTADGVSTEQLVYIESGETEEVNLELPSAPSAALSQALASADKPTPENGFSLPSEGLGWLAGASLATIAAVASGQAVQGYQGELAKLGLGKAWSQKDVTGVQIVIAIDRHTPEGKPDQTVPTPRVRLWHMFGTNAGQHDRLHVPNPNVGLSATDMKTVPGGYWLELQDADRRQRRGFKLATIVLPGYVTLIIRHQIATGRVEILQFAISRHPDGFEAGLRALVNAEALQRARMLGRDPLVDPVAIALAEGSWFEPFSAMVIAATLIDRGEEALGMFIKTVSRLQEAEIMTVETHVLLAVAADRAGRPEEASMHFAKALSLQQAPVVDLLLNHLEAGARAYRLRGKEQRWITEKMRQTVGHPIWTLRREDDKKRSGKPDVV